MDAPSAQLRNLLTDLQLVTPSQWRQCRGAVRAFVRDLPAFDSVWIDGLVRIGAITLFQAEWISRGEGEQLAVGPYLLKSSLGRDELLFSFAGVHRATGQRVWLTRWNPGRSDDLEILRTRFQSLVMASTELRKAARLLQGLVAEVHELDGSFWFVSPFIEGMTAASLVIRRGRFPADVVRGICVQLIQRLAIAERAGLLHGDLRLSHLLLSQNGRVSLVHHGILDHLIPEITIHSKVPLESLEGLAPERILHPKLVSSRAEIYACGCLLWQLLTGRPPYLSADPLRKRAAHLKGRIPDVRELAPDVPEALAILIKEMTAPDENSRPDSFQELAERVKTLGGTQEQRIASFVKAFETASTHPWWRTEFVRAPQTAPATGSSLWTTAATVGVALTAGIFARPFLNEFIPNQPQQIQQAAPVTAAELSNVNSGITQAAHVSRSAIESTPAILTLPAPSAEGIVTLEGGQVYRAASLQAAGPLLVQAPLSKPAIILVGEDSWHISCTSLKLQGVEVRRTTHPTEAPLLNAQAQLLQIEHCRFTGQGVKPVAAVAISWTVPDPQEKSSAQVSIRETGFLQCGTAIHMQSPLMGAIFENVVKTGTGSLLNLQAGVGAGYQVRLFASRLTLCDSGPIVSMPMEAAVNSGKLIIEGQDSALAPADDNPLLLLTGSLLMQDWHQHFEVAASGIVLREGTSLAGFQGTTGPSLSRIIVPIDTNDLKVDGLLIGSFLFSGIDLSNPDECIAIAENIPLHLAGSPLGATLDAFPVPDVPAEMSEAARKIKTPRIAPQPFPNYNSAEVR